MEKKDKKRRVFVCSDPHINHKNLIRGISNWNDKSGCRPFKNREEHNNAIINGINDNVGEDDILYCLGDWSFGGIGSIWWFRKQLNVKDIRFIFGNHDHHLEANKELIIPKEDHNFDMEMIEKRYEKEGLPYYKFYLDGKEWIGEYMQGDLVIPAQDLFTWCKYYAEVKHFGHTYVLSHYAFDVWNKRHHGRMHLFGHSHGSLPDRGDRRMDVGFEEAYRILGEWRPFEINECQSILQSRPVKPLDHHNKNTTE